ncbi:SusD/RagB family nutrient-binding outer membrane lipoprotein [Cellulophaga sp. Ld12]|uniref:SusD/RagB family nutrient-binding outer membrane lipoprotein n=1 Tax=Cellulophaga sp. Ld12 TaxID=3229535 RepID=UPI0038632B48
MKKILILLTAVVATSCSDNLENLNQNIKDPTAVPGESLFTGAQKNLVDQVVDLNVNLNNTKLWAQYLQETQYTDESNYDQVTRTIPQSHWNAMYKDVLKDLNTSAEVIAETEYALPADAATKANKLVVVEVMKIYAYSNLVEVFGDVPYTEAGDIENLLPKYDDGLTIYKDLIERLTIAIDAFDTTNGSFGNADRLYSGDVTMWKKFANSLKLRMGILLSDVDNSYAEATVIEAIASGVFTSNEDNATYAYLSADPNTNPIYDNLILSGRTDFVAATTIVDHMNSLNDPRRPLYFQATADGTFKGGTIGEVSNFGSFSHVSARLETPTEPGVLLDYAEVSFLQAEAIARNFAIAGTAKQFYEEGIKASVAYWGGASADADTYIAQTSVDYDAALAASTATEPWKEVIGTQKWIALYNRGLEGWTSIRLLDYPLMATPVDAVSGYPARYTYPIQEQTLNGANYEAATTAIGGDAAETKLFWDLN